MDRKLNLFVPQWQGSGFTNELYYGAQALKGEVEGKGLELREVPISLNPDLTIYNGILGYSEIRKQLNSIHEIINENSPEKIFSIGGGCGIEIPIVSYLSEKYENMDIIWFDAHGDLNTPESSPSGHFHGMPLRFLLDDIKGNPISEFFNKIKSKDLQMVGVRDLDQPEKDYIEENSIKTFNDINSDSLLDSCNIDNKNVYIHIDLDVIDPVIYKNVKCPTKNGLGIDKLTDMLETLKTEKNIVGMSILENTEQDRDKIKVLDGIINIGINL